VGGHELWRLDRDRNEIKEKAFGQGGKGDVM